MSQPDYRNYWLDTVRFPSGTENHIPRERDVVIVGAGFTGLSAALQLAKRGFQVAVLEEHTIGFGASSRNGGMVLTGLKLPAETLFQRYGKETTRQLYAASLASIDFIEHCVNEEGIDCDFVRCGHLEVASKPVHFAAYSRNVELVGKEFGHKINIVERRDLHFEIGSDLYYGGIVDTLSAGVNPAKLVAGLAQAAMRAGAEVFEHVRAERVEGKKVISTRGDVRARATVTGTGAYTSHATPSLQRRVIPVGSFIIATEPLPASVAAELNPRSRMIYDSRHYLHYFRLTADRRMLFGGRAAFSPETRNTVRRSAKILHRDLLKTYPQLRGVNIDYAWGGTLDFCFDMLPHAGTLDGFHYAAGFAGHGVAMACYLGAQIARRIAGESFDNPFEHIPCPTAPLGLYDGRPWFLPFAGAWYKLLDWTT